MKGLHACLRRALRLLQKEGGGSKVSDVCPFCREIMDEPMEFDAEMYVACRPCRRVFKYPLILIKKSEDLG